MHKKDPNWWWYNEEEEKIIMDAIKEDYFGLLTAYKLKGIIYHKTGKDLSLGIIKKYLKKNKMQNIIR